MIEKLKWISISVLSIFSINSYGFFYDSTVALGRTHTCAIVQGDVKCWGDNNYSQTDVPELKNPTQITAGYRHTCVLADGGVKCWGNKFQGKTEVPKLKNPIQISAGRWHTCAIDDEGVKCWRSNFGNVPELKSPTHITSGNNYTCAITVAGVKCWGDNHYGQTDVPELKNPTYITAGDAHTCAITEEGVKCWGSNYYGQTDVPELKNPTYITAGGDYTCAITEEGVKCWGNHYRYQRGQMSIPELKNPIYITAGGAHDCAHDDEGMKCWGNNKYGQSNVPKGFAIKFSIQKMNFYFREIAKILYHNKGHFLKRVSDKYISDSKFLPLFNFYAFKGFFEEIPNEVLANQVLNDHRFAQQRISKGFSVNQLYDIPHDLKTLKHSLWLLKQNLKSIKYLVSRDAKESIDHLIPQLDKLLRRIFITREQAETFVVHLNKQKKLFRDLNQAESYKPYHALIKDISRWITWRDDTFL